MKRRWVFSPGFPVEHAAAKTPPRHRLAPLRFARLVLVGVIGGSTALTMAACNGKATRVECNEMLDKYLDMIVAGEPGLLDLPPAEARAAREMKKAIRKSEPSYARVENQCESEISKSEYRCAMKAPTPETWQACID